MDSVFNDNDFIVTVVIFLQKPSAQTPSSWGEPRGGGIRWQSLEHSRENKTWFLKMDYTHRGVYTHLPKLPIRLAINR